MIMLFKQRAYSTLVGKNEKVWGCMLCATVSDQEAGEDVGRACTYLPLSRCSSLHHTPGNRVFLRRKDGPPLIISCKNSKNSGAIGTESDSAYYSGNPNLNLKAKFCQISCRCSHRR